MPWRGKTDSPAVERQDAGKDTPIPDRATAYSLKLVRFGDLEGVLVRAVAGIGEPVIRRCRYTQNDKYADRK
jgi:hypothetical protein